MIDSLIEEIRIKHEDDGSFTWVFIPKNKKVLKIYKEMNNSVWRYKTHGGKMFLEETGDKSLWKNLILICHNPPKGKTVDAVNVNLHAGSELFTNYIEENQPLAVICGHIHEGAGMEKIGETLVINPGSLGEAGSYALMEIVKEGDFWQIKDAKICKL